MILLGEQTLSVARYSTRTVVAGEVVRSGLSTLSITASVQPLKGYELQQLQEGDRDQATHKLYTETELELGDFVEVRGAQHRVAAVLDYDAFDLPHFKILLVSAGGESP